MRCLLIISLAVLSLASAIPIVSRSDNAAIVEFFKYLETKQDETMNLILDRAVQLYENIIAEVPTELQGQRIAALKEFINHVKTVQLSGSSQQKIDVLISVQAKNIFDDRDLMKYKDEPEAEIEIFFKIADRMVPDSPGFYLTNGLITPLHIEFTKAAAILKTKMSPATLESEGELFEAIQNYIDSDDIIISHNQMMEHFLTFKNKYSTVSN